MRIYLVLVGVVVLLVSLTEAVRHVPRPQHNDASEDGVLGSEWTVRLYGEASDSEKGLAALLSSSEHLGRLLAHDSTTTLNKLMSGNVVTLRHPNAEADDESVRAVTEALQSAVTSGRLASFTQELAFKRERRNLPTPLDPLFPSQWHLNNTGQNGIPGPDVQVSPVWKTGVWGDGVTICLVDDGIDHEHPDIAPNYNAAASYDVNYRDKDPGSDRDGDNHGTSAAGVAGAHDESTCGVGSAPRVGLSCARLISKAATDSDEVDALTLDGQVNDIYSNSWGPSDNGRTLQGPGPLLTAAFEEAVSSGRGGLGSIYVWASGNGAVSKDSCNYDGYANSKYTIAVGAVSYRGVRSSYSEGCSALMVVAPSSGDSRYITTTDRLGSKGYGSTDCNTNFGGTSSACPLAAGIIALMLEANPLLTWRDVQYILVTTTAPIDPTNSGWMTNGAGLRVSDSYGFGLVNATAAVAAAREWKTVPSMDSVYGPQQAVAAAIADNSLAGVSKTFMMLGSPLRVEWVEVVIDVTHPYRGQLKVTLTSPAGTTSTLANTRSDPNPDYNDWMFTSVQYWGESSSGLWTLTVSDLVAGQVGTWNTFSVNMFGVECSRVPGTGTCEVPCGEVGGLPAYLDECGVCGGDSSSCLGCNGLHLSSGGLQLDLCGVCGGNNACVDKCGVPFGTNDCVDDCGVPYGSNACTTKAGGGLTTSSSATDDDSNNQISETTGGFPANLFGFDSKVVLGVGGSVLTLVLVVCVGSSCLAVARWRRETERGNSGYDAVLLFDGSGDEEDGFVEGSSGPGRAVAAFGLGEDDEENDEDAADAARGGALGTDLDGEETEISL